MKPLFFVPNAKAGDAELLDAVGLEALGLDELRAVDVAASNLPDALRELLPEEQADAGGCCLRWGGEPFANGGLADFEWQAAKPWPERSLAAGRFLMGRQGPVTPADLERPKMLESLPTILDDGYAWQLPIAAYLPKVYGIRASDGRETFDVAPEFVEYCELAAEFQQAALSIANGRPIHSLNVMHAFRLAELGLRINYRLNRDVADWLGILRDEDTIFWAACASFELPRYKELTERAKSGDAMTHPRYLQALPFLNGMTTPYKPKLFDAMLLALNEHPSQPGARHG